MIIKPVCVLVCPGGGRWEENKMLCGTVMSEATKSSVASTPQTPKRRMEGRVRGDRRIHLGKVSGDMEGKRWKQGKGE